MRIEVDYREKSLIKILEVLRTEYDFYHIEIETKNLPLGDLIIYDDSGRERLIIERKTLNDLSSSIKDGRYTEQSFRLDNYEIHNHNIIYLLEGKMALWEDRRKKMTSKTLYTTMFSLHYYKGFMVIRTDDVSETAEYILRMTDKMHREKKKKSYYESGEKKEKKYSEVVNKVKKKNIKPENIGEIILSQIPGVSSSTSLLLMKKFGSLYNLLDALKKDGNCLDNLSYTLDSGVKRRVSKTSIRNISQYLLYQKSNVIKIETDK